jgi:hypothetical protein
MAGLDAENVVKLYQEAKSLRNPHENDWRMASAYCLPSHYSAWQTDGPASYHQKNSAARRVAFDTTGTRSLPKYVSILERLATPSGQAWHNLTASDPALRKKRRVKAYFDDLRDLLFKYRYNPAARFRVSSNEMYTSMGVYGNGPLFIGERSPNHMNRTRGFKYVACPMRDTFMLVDDEGNLHSIFRRFWLNVRQFKAKFPGEKFPSQMQAEAGKPTPNENNYFEFVHYVCPRDEGEYDPSALDARRHPYSGKYVCVKSKEFVGDDTGYQSMPYKVPRTATVAGDPYGYSPAVAALAALGGASSMKKTNLKQGNKAVDPVLLAHDDNVLNGEVDLRPGAVNYGGVSREGRKLIQALETGNFRVAEVLLQDERADIEDSFFVTLFQILTDTPEMTATEVMERVAEKAALLSPTMGRLQSEFLGPTIEREIDLLAEIGRLPPMPPELVEAEGEYEVVYTSPLAKSMYAEEVSGFMRAVEMGLNIAQATQDTSSLDHFNFDDALPEIADYMAVPARWMNDPDVVAQKRGERADSQQNSELLSNAPAIASAMKTVSEAQKQ